MIVCLPKVAKVLSQYTGLGSPTGTPKVYGLIVMVPEAANPPAQPGPAAVNV